MPEASPPKILRLRSQWLLKTHVTGTLGRQQQPSASYANLYAWDTPFPHKVVAPPIARIWLENAPPPLTSCRSPCSAHLFCRLCPHVKGLAADLHRSVLQPEPGESGLRGPERPPHRWQRRQGRANAFPTSTGDGCCSSCSSTPASLAVRAWRVEGVLCELPGELAERILRSSCQCSHVRRGCPWGICWVILPLLPRPLRRRGPLLAARGPST